MDNLEDNLEHETMNGAEAQDAGAALQDCQAQLAQARQSAEEYRDKYLRQAAQLDNARKHYAREAEYQASNAERTRLRALLDVVDNLERALAQPANQAALREGVALTLRQLENVLARSGVHRLAVEPGDRFDPSQHEAIAGRPGLVEEDVIEAVTQPGYRLDAELLRPARVFVVQSSQEHT